jgi:hypothetical protein
VIDLFGMVPEECVAMLGFIAPPPGIIIHTLGY